MNNTGRAPGAHPPSFLPQSLDLRILGEKYFLSAHILYFSEAGILQLLYRRNYCNVLHLHPF